MTKEQEIELNKLLDAEIPVMRRTIQTHGQQMMAARAAATAPATGGYSPRLRPLLPAARSSRAGSTAAGTPNCVAGPQRSLREAQYLQVLEFPRKCWTPSK